jgi:hypothetical protein
MRRCDAFFKKRNQAAFEEDGCIPPESDAEFVWAMETVLDVYHRPYASAYPVVCMDEKPKPLVKETRPPLPCRQKCPERFDFEYQRNGTANVFRFVEPLKGWRRGR